MSRAPAAAPSHCPELDTTSVKIGEGSFKVTRAQADGRGMRRPPYEQHATLARRPVETGRPDPGMSVIEVLVSIVLLGTLVAATLVGLSTTINASSLDRDHANAHAWLQTAADMLYARDVITCGTLDPADALTDVALVAQEYENTVRQTDNPEGWPASSIEVIGLAWWSIDIGVDGVGTEAWGTQCDAGDTNLQKVALRVTAEDGRIVEEVEVIIGG